MTTLKKIFAIVLLSFSAPAFSQSGVDGISTPELNRQVTQQDQQLSDQVQQVRIASARQKYDPLRMNVIMQFPTNVKTVQQAAQYLLETAKYKLVLNPTDPDGARQIFSRTLLPQDANGTLQTIENALLQIGGDDTVLIIDRENKLISFEFQSR